MPETTEFKDFLKTFSPRERYAIALIIGLTLVGMVFHWMWIPLVNLVLHDPSHEELAAIGEAYIIFHSFFDMLAWTVVVLALVAQFRDARHRDRQFARQMEAQRVQSVFLPYLGLLKDGKKEFRCSGAEGQKAFEQIVVELGRHGSDPIENNKVALTNYHRHLEALLEFVAASRLLVAEKNHYLKLLKAQLSEEELIAIGACREHQPGRNLKELVDKLRKENVQIEIYASASAPGVETPA